MPPHIHPKVEEVRNSPSADESVRLALVVEKSHHQDVKRAVQRLGGEIRHELPSGVLTVSVQELKLDELCNLEGLKSVSPDGELRVLA